MRWWNHGGERMDVAVMVVNGCSGGAGGCCRN